MSRSPRRPAELRRRIFRGSEVRRLGLLTASDLRSTGWHRLFRDVYADADIPLTHEVRAWAAGRYAIPAGAAIAGRSAAALHGAGLIATEEPVEVLSIRDFGPVKGLEIHRGPLPPSQVVALRGGVRVTTPLRTGWDLGRWQPAEEAVAHLDVLLARGVLRTPELTAYVAAQQGEPGWRRVSETVALADPAAESPQESRLRVRLVRAGLPVPVAQFVLADEGRFVARFALAWPGSQVAVEYDGVWHATREQLERDRARLNGVLGAGWTVIHVTAARMRDDFPGIVREVRAALTVRANLW
ncbi:MAG: hypothetical protein HOV77_12205 [Hamadaea sp.]|uniref:endonuclease domain-containing protein n=1 Tax=Hamadaea sp. TaxID=2024425 RepID=UPI0017C3F507|nr:hypothetical protein [Hamadaea sp.]NUT19945.1 hypothetical protein [Hamadaea sp.]